jgi:hypothetical protein
MAYFADIEVQGPNTNYSSTYVQCASTFGFTRLAQTYNTLSIGLKSAKIR